MVCMYVCMYGMYVCMYVGDRSAAQLPGCRRTGDDGGGGQDDVSKMWVCGWRGQEEEVCAPAGR